MRSYSSSQSGRLPLPGDGIRFTCSKWVVLREVALGILGLAQLVGASEPHIPAHDAIVVARLRTGQLPAAERELRSLQSRLAAAPTDLPLALEVARRQIRRARAEADPRFLGQAQVALSPWWNESTPPAAEASAVGQPPPAVTVQRVPSPAVPGEIPVEVLVLRATIRQSMHDFDSALSDLDAALAREPRHVGAWLTKATIHTVRTEFAEARRAATQLTLLTDPLTATTVAANLASLTGNAANAYTQLTAALARSQSSPVDHQPSAVGNRQSAIEPRVWALNTLAEMAARLDRREEAERHFRAALQLAPADPYLLGAFADFLLDQGRADEVMPLLRPHTQIDGLLLRHAEAEALAGRPSAKDVAELRARFDTARARGERVHLREEARFHLRLLGVPVTALALARDNWRVQREPADARLLLESSRAAKDAAAEREVLVWLAETRLEDVSLRASPIALRPQ
jgi:tetratricopeptide (TPR) repeat protein